MISISDIKQIPIENWLASIGHKPTKQRGNDLWYCSPIRSERSASFKVNTNLNVWYDYGIGKGGNIIDLAKAVYQTDYIPTLLSKIDSSCLPSFSIRQTPRSPKPTTSCMTDIRMQQLEMQQLISYLYSRGIQRDVAIANCKEAHYVVAGKQYYAVAFANDSGGHELRNKYFKGCIGRKDISTISRGSTCVCIFEGFIDYLSAIVMGVTADKDCIVLNSVCNIAKAIPKLSNYESIECYLDNDDAGRRTTAELSSSFGDKVTDKSTLYPNYNDVNDYLMSGQWHHNIHINKFPND
jgi:hypothetical protein